MTRYYDVILRAFLQPIGTVIRKNVVVGGLGHLVLYWLPTSPYYQVSHVRVALGSDCTCEVGVGTSSMSRPHLRWGMSKLALDDVPVW